LSVHAAPIGFLAMLDRGGDVDEEKVAAGTRSIRDCVAYGLPSGFMRCNRRSDNSCTSTRELRRNKCYLLQVIVALFARKGTVCEKQSEPRQAN
jgi:hypothetical protein